MKAAYDPTYDQRVGARNKLKTEAITRALENEFGLLDSVLDIGCNAGYITQALLDGGITASACGFDLSRDVVSASLMADPRFSFIEGDVVEHAFSETYDGIIYAAVHHHILGLNGWDAALELWCKIVSSCNRVLVFETGSVLETGKLYWKDAILRHFGGDREHLDALLKATKNRLVEVEEITRLPINGADRPVQLLTFKPIYYDCHVVTGSGSASRGLHPFLSAWAGTRRINLYPGTLSCLGRVRLTTRIPGARKMTTTAPTTPGYTRPG